ncbi:MAG: hypothetical protein ACT4QE_24495 [Anaerolineales bacterium]
MKEEGPLLETFTRRLAETPPDFLAEPRIGAAGVVNVGAVISDVLVALGGAPLGAKDVERLNQPADKKLRNRLRLKLIGAWLLHDEWFQQRGGLAEIAGLWLVHALDESAALTEATKFVTDPERREELARLCLKELGLRPAGESEAQAQDRLATLNTAERQRVIAAARAAEERARQIREAMARQAAEEAADKWTRE